eukprot:3413173-Rhodomonas_salina.2
MCASPRSRELMRSASSSSGSALSNAPNFRDRDTTPMFSSVLATSKRSSPTLSVPVVTRRLTSYVDSDCPFSPNTAYALPTFSSVLARSMCSLPSLLVEIARSVLQHSRSLAGSPIARWTLPMLE